MTKQKIKTARKLIRLLIYYIYYNRKYNRGSKIETSD
jgi:hypothetical protein